MTVLAHLVFALVFFTFQVFASGSDVNPFPDVIADSRSDFSGVQGQSGWFYGYRDYTADGGGTDYNPASSFIKFSDNQWTGQIWDQKPGRTEAPWTEIGPEESHPNGANEPAPDNHEIWSIRRWAASGLAQPTSVRLRWQIREVDSGWSGVTGAIYLNGQVLDSASIEGTDTNGVMRTNFVTLAHSDIVDLVHTPVGPSGNRSDWNDLSALWLVIDRKTNPLQTVKDCFPAPAGLVAWWPLEGDAVDIIGTNNGTVHNSKFAPGVRGRGIELTGNNGSYVSVSNSPTLNPTAEISVEAWVKPVSYRGSGSDSIVEKSFTTRTIPYYQYHLQMTGDQYGGESPATFGIAVTAGTGSYTPVYTPTGFWTSGNWYHLVGVYNGSKVQLFVNGELISEAAASGAMIDYGMPVWIGGHPNTGTTTPGTFDEVSIYSRALSSNEIASLFLAGSAGKCISPAYSLTSFFALFVSGLSTGSAYSVSGHFAPWVADHMSADAFALDSAFWEFEREIQRPTLVAGRGKAGEIVLSWVPSTSALILQETLSISSKNWLVSSNAATTPIVIPANSQTKFFRLYKP